jgi:hypothetical protein
MAELSHRRHCFPPVVLPGRYRVEMSLGSQTMAAEFAVVKDPRLATTPEGYRQQFELGGN